VIFKHLILTVLPVRALLTA